MAERTRAHSRPTRDTLQAHPPRTRTRKTYLLEMMSQTESSLVSLVISSPSTRGEETTHQAPKWVRDSRKAFVGSSPLGKLPTSSTVCACAARVGCVSSVSSPKEREGKGEKGRWGRGEVSRQRTHYPGTPSTQGERWAQSSYCRGMGSCAAASQ